MKIREPRRLNLMQKQGLRKVGKSQHRARLLFYHRGGEGKERGGICRAENQP